MAGRRNDSTLVTAAALGALTGIRSMAGPAAMARALGDDLPPVLGLKPPGIVAPLISLAAAGEVVADKLPWIPARTSPLSLASRMVLGSLSAITMARHRGQPALLPAVLGACAAAGATVAIVEARRHAVHSLRLPDLLAGLLEDALVLALTRRIEESIWPG